MIVKRWVKPRVNEEWGYKTAYIGKKELVADHYNIRWKDGHQQITRVVLVDYMTIVRDMHLQREVQGTFPNIVIKYHGQKMLIPIDVAKCEFLI